MNENEMYEEKYIISSYFSEITPLKVQEQLSKTEILYVNETIRNNYYFN